MFLSILSFGWDLILFIVALSILILVHELGHFFFAKKFKVYCYEFSLGMGPLIHQWSRKNDETKYSIRALPIGGYVAMAGETNFDGIDVPHERTINGVSSWKKMIITVAGVMNNFLLALVLFFGIFAYTGVPVDKYHLVVEKDSIVYDAGLQTRDEINRVTSTIREEGKEDVVASVELDKLIDVIDFLSENTPKEEVQVQYLVFDITRGEESKSINFERHYVDKKAEIIGISIVQEAKRVNVFKTFGYAAKYEWKVMGLIFQGVTHLFTRQGFKNVGGPIQIFKVTSAAAKLGFIYFLNLLAILSANLGVVNLMPIPGLDGAAFIVSAYETVTRRKVKAKVINIINMIGLILLLTLMGVIIVKDIIMLF